MLPGLQLIKQTRLEVSSFTHLSLTSWPRPGHATTYPSLRLTTAIATRTLRQIQTAMTVKMRYKWPIGRLLAR